MPTQKPKVFAQSAAFCVFFVGVMVLLGWSFDITALKSFLPGLPKVAPITMLVFFLAAVSLWCPASETPNAPGGKYRRPLLRIGQVCAVIVATIGLFRLCEYVFGWNLNFEMLGFHEVAVERGPPARMAQATALGSLLIGGALLLVTRSRGFMLFQILIFTTGLIGCLGILRYIYGGEPLLPYSQMSAITALCFLLLSSGTFCLRTDGGLMALLVADSAGGLLARRILPPTVVIPFAIGWLRLKAQQAGWFGTEAGLSLFALSNVIVFAALVWVAANLLHRADSKRKQQEAEIRQSEARYRTLFETLTEGFCTIEVIFDNHGKAVDFRYLETNPAFEKQAGLYNVQGRLISELVPDLEAHWFEIFGKIALTGESANFDNEAKALGRHYDVCAYRVGEPESRKVAILFNDITERKNIQNELQQHREHLQDLVDEHTASLRDSAALINAILSTVPDAIITISEHGMVETFNPSAERIFAYTSAEVVGRNVNLLMPEPYRSAHDSHLESYHTTGETRVLGTVRTFEGRRKDGSLFPLEIAVNKMQLADGTHFTAIMRDITQRKLYEQMLVAAKAEAEQANRAKSSFLATMSHELRTPLNAIIGFTGILLMKLPGPLNMEQDKHLKTVQTSAKHLLSLINDLLDVVKIEAGKVELAIMPVDCCVVLDEIATSLRQLAEAKGLSFILSLPQQPLILHTDQRALSQIIINLANNAIKFTEQGTINIKVLRRKVRGEKTIEISVTDTGVGISLDDQARLFKSFERLNVSIQSAKEGTGLGLHLSQKLAQELGGKISVRSKPGVGSTFTLVLPEL